MSTLELSKIFSVSRSTISRDLRKLQRVARVHAQDDAQKDVHAQNDTQKSKNDTQNDTQKWHIDNVSNVFKHIQLKIKQKFNKHKNLPNFNWFSKIRAEDFFNKKSLKMVD